MPSRPASNEAPVRAGIYCRISLASMGDTTKVDDQERICRDLARNLGWEVADVYQDHARSAWQPNRKRPAWDRMIADIGEGKLSGIVVYHGDRLLRTHEDLLTLIKLARSRGVKLASPAGTRDLGSYDDQFILEIEASMAKRESANTSRRRQAQYERWRREGRVRPGGRGGRAYAFATDGVSVIEAEAEIVREMARRVLAGESVGSIARDVSARGARTPTGGEFSHTTVKAMLKRPRYAGLMPDGESAAAWPAVLGREDWELVRLALEAKALQFDYATNARRWLLSGIAACSECGGAMRLHPTKGHGRKEYQQGYSCVTKGCGKAYRSAPHLDAYVSARVVGRLNNPGNPQPDAPAEPGHGAEWGALTAERAATVARLRDYTTSAGMLDHLAARLEGIDARMAQLRELADDSRRQRLVAQYQGITLKAFLDLPLDVRRALVQATVTVTVLPASRRGPGFHPEDVRVEPLVLPGSMGPNGTRAPSVTNEAINRLSRLRGIATHVHMHVRLLQSLRQSHGNLPAALAKTGGRHKLVSSK